MKNNPYIMPWLDVITFMMAADQSVTKDNTKQAELYKNLITEEYNEFQEAIKNNDEVEIIDACFDMMWVIIGYMKSRGMDIDEIWDEGKRSNLAKINKITGTVLKREDGKVMKPDGWTPPDFSKFVKK